MLLLGLTSSDGTTAETIRVAVALPLSGAHSALGRDVKAAVELAVADYRTRTGAALCNELVALPAAGTGGSAGGFCARAFRNDAS